MSSKSPVRSCEDVDETALSYAEIKALCAGNPLIAEKMNLDNEVAKLRILKSEHQSQHYRLEDDLLKRFPEQIASVTERIKGIETDIARYAAVKKENTELKPLDGGGVSASVKFPGMTINNVTYTEKETAAKALLEACKEVIGKKGSMPVGEYMGFSLSLTSESFASQINLLMRGAMTYKIDLGTDTFGNITRINNALDDLPKRLEGAKDSLENLERQVEAAKAELEKPFPQEAELSAKESRLSELNSELNIDGDGGLEIIGESRDTDDDEPDISEPEAGSDDDEPDIGTSDEVRPFNRSVDRDEKIAASAKAKPSILAELKNFDSKKNNGEPGRDKPDERDI